MFPEDRFLEVLIIGALALIVVGPKDLPILMRKVGRVVGKVRGMAAEFRASFDELARQSELDELRREVEALRSGQQAATPYPESPMHAAAAEPDVASMVEAAPAPVAPAPKPPAKPRGKPAAKTVAKSKSSTKAKTAAAVSDSPGEPS